MTNGHELVERERELRRLRAAAGAATAGRGASLVVQGPPGIGKTALLRRIGDLSDAAVLTAAGTELERELAFGVVRQLFERPLLELAGTRRREVLSGAAARAARIVLEPDLAPAGPEGFHAALHGLYWLAAQWAAHEPLVLVVDDVHWADAASLRWLAYLGRRLDGVALLVVLARRPGEPGTPVGLLDGALGEAGVEVLAPEPLTEDGTSRWLARRFGRPPADEVVRACWRATGGNPLLLREVAATLEADGVGAAGRIGALAPDGLARGVLRRLAPLGPDAAAVAEAVAVLSADARLDHAATLAGLAVDRTAEVADLLADAGVLAGRGPLRFEHPLLRTAVEEEIPSARRGLLHLAAARRLRDDGEAPERIASHLLAAPPGRRPWVAATLRAAASRAAARGAPDHAVGLLRRALAEPPADRGAILLELARAEAIVRDPAAVAHAVEGMEQASDPAKRIEAAVSAIRSLILAHRLPEALEVLTRAAPEPQALDAASRRVLEAEALVLQAWREDAVGLDERLAALGVGDRPPRTPEDHLLLALRVMALVTAGDDRERPRALARLALAGKDAEWLQDQHAALVLGRSLAVWDDVDGARALLTRLVARGRARGEVAAVAGACAMRADAELRAGRLLDAEADAREALALAREHGIGVVVPSASATLGEVLLEREGAEPALGVLAQRGVAGAELPRGYTTHLLLHARGLARGGAGDLEGALRDLRACAEAHLAWGDRNPATLAWRSSLALALAAAGRGPEAAELVDEELRLARRFGAPRAIGVALRAGALVGPPGRREAGLREAVAALADSPARLEHARAVLDLGALLRRGGQRVEARAVLAVGLDAAHGCAATRLAARGRAELIAAGARPRRERLRGPEALTASERRVAEHAAQGLTNRQIAQALFVTTKTVEMHLGRVYGKLGIPGRAALAAGLSPAGPEEQGGHPVAALATGSEPRR